MSKMVTMFDSDLQMILDQTTKRCDFALAKTLFLHATQRSWILKFARLRARKESRREVLDHFLVEGIAGCHY